MLPLELCTDRGRLFRFGLWATGLDVHQKCECLGSESNRHRLRPLDAVQPAAGSELVADNPDQCWSIYLPPIWRREWPHSLRAERIHPALRPNLMEKKSINKCCYEAVFGFMVMMKLGNIFPGLWRWMVWFFFVWVKKCIAASKLKQPFCIYWYYLTWWVGKFSILF